MNNAQPNPRTPAGLKNWLETATLSLKTNPDLKPSDLDSAPFESVAILQGMARAAACRAMDCGADLMARAAIDLRNGHTADARADLRTANSHGRTAASLLGALAAFQEVV